MNPTPQSLTLSGPEASSTALLGPDAARPRLGALTTLRFFAALHVVLFHMKVIGILTDGPWWYQNFAGIGYVGVNFFFVLSGFILVYTYAGPSLSVWRFWQARFARVCLPVLVTCCCAIFLFCDWTSQPTVLRLEQRTSCRGVYSYRRASSGLGPASRPNLELRLLEPLGRSILLLCFLLVRQPLIFHDLRIYPSRRH